jgi:tRNA (guanine10-N2)-dimethyltransferase
MAMKLIYSLSRANLALSKAEALALTGARNSRLEGNLLICVSSTAYAERIALSHQVDEFLFETDEENMASHIRKFDWQSIYKKDFCVRVHGIPSPMPLEKEYATLIWRALKTPKVNLDDPGMQIDFFIAGGKVICGRLLGRPSKDYLSRKAHMRPFNHPTSMHPALARACINLSGVKSGRLLDPFCGSGGILIEAGLMGYEILGYDIDQGMIERCRANLSHYRLNGYRLEKGDATQALEKADVIVTDLPYGRNSRVTEKDLDKLYSGFLKAAASSSKAAVIVFPDSSDYTKIISNSGWKMGSSFRHYIHRGLSRIIVKLRR